MTAPTLTPEMAISLLAIGFGKTGPYALWADIRSALEGHANRTLASIPTVQLEAMRAESERLKRALDDEKRRSFIDSRISYRGFCYGVGSQFGIDSLRQAIDRNEDY